MITSMSQLLTVFKDELLKYKRTSLAKVDTSIKRGVFAPADRPPMIALMPQYEICDPPYSGGQYKVRRKINVEVWVSLLNAKEAMKETMELFEEVKEIAQKSDYLNNQVLDIVYSTEQGTFGLSTPPDVKFMQRSVLPLTFVTKEKLPTDRKEWMTPNLREGKASTLTTVIYNALSNYRDANPDKVQRLTDYASPPQAVNRELTLVPVEENLDHDWAGVDGVHRTYKIWYMTKLFGAEKSLDDNLAVVEEIKDAIFSNLQWDGYCINSWIPRVDFLQDTKELRYVTEMSLETLGKENL